MSLALCLLMLSQAPQPAPRAAPSAEELMGRLDQSKDLKDKDKTFEIAASLGKLYYAHARFNDAVTYLEQAVSKAAPARAQYLEWRKKAGSKPMPAPASVGCAPSGDVALDAQLKLAQDKAKTDVAAAAACVRVGLHGLMEVETQLGNAQFVLHQPDAAMKTYERALELFETNPDARYGRAALLLDTKGDDLKALAAAKADFQRVLNDYPTSPKAKSAKQLLERTDAAIAAGGMSKLAAQAPVAPAPGAGESHPPMLTKEMVEAVQNVEQTPEMAQGFDKLVDQAEEHLAKGRFQEALDNYKRVVPFQPENARARAGMAWSLVRLNKQPMADNVWRVASANPEAIDGLGDALKAKGDEAGAKQVWARLKETVPAYASKLQGKAP